MTAKKPKVELEYVEEDPLAKLENRVFVLEQMLARHMGYHFGGINLK